MWARSAAVRLAGSEMCVFMALETWHELRFVVDSDNKRLLAKLKSDIAILQDCLPCIEVGFSC